MPRGRPEQKLQTKIVTRLRREFACLPVAVPNGGTRGKIEAIRLKEMGVTAGHPDLIVYGTESRLVLLEVKVPGESLSYSQKRVIPDLQGRGFPVFTVDSVEAAVDALHECGFAPPTVAAFLSRETGGF